MEEAILTHKISEKVKGLIGQEDGTEIDSEETHTVEGFVYDRPPIKTESLLVFTIYKLYRNDNLVNTIANPNKLDQNDLIAECAKLLTQPKLFM